MIGRVLSLALAATVAASVSVSACAVTEEDAVSIYPTADHLPENLLRMYVYFPRPMSADEGLDSIRLLDQTGAPLTDVFLRNREDLWSPDRRRLTVLFDPGRVKTGLDANDTMGRALIPGHQYTFLVLGSARDASGCPLGEDYKVTFTAGAADISPPNPSTWGLNDPQSGTHNTLVVSLGSPHDHLSMAFRLRLYDSAGQVVPGAIELGPDEASWRFRPSSPWYDAEYALMIGEQLEDLAGNRPGVLFDRPLDQDPLPWVRELTFTPRP